MGDSASQQALPPAQRIPASDDFPTGPAAGEPFPEFTLRNQRGESVSFESARAGRRALLLFHRSARWCAFCRTALVELQRALPAFQAVGVWIAAISNDPVGDLAQFGDEHDISFDLLSDPSSRLIQRIGILNTLIAPGELLYGIPFPGAYVVDEAGVIRSKYFHREFQIREAPSFILSDGFGVFTSDSSCPSATTEDTGARLDAVFAAPDLKPFQRVHLWVSLTAAAGWGLVDTPDVAIEPGDDLAIRGRTWLSPGVLRVEMLSEARDVESVPVDVFVSCMLRDPSGAMVERRMEVRLHLPVGDLNRASTV